MIGQTLAHYRIIGSLGAGGMGEVFRATDTKLGREVALKVLPVEFGADPDRLDRFQREARALAALDHPGIVTVHSVEEADGVRFFTMQLVEGESLDRAIPETGMSLGRWLAIAIPLADALSAAHAKGIVHRDLKPSNVVVTSTGVKILDFGLAKIVEPPRGDAVDPHLPTLALTQEGVVMGTVPYMSPEQVRGERLDARSDLFSLGAILYEMATGRRPFQADSSVELMSAILGREPTPPSEIEPTLPPRIEEVVLKALDKDPALRYQTAAGLRGDLLRLRRDASDESASRARAPSAVRGLRPSKGAIPMGSRRGVWLGVGALAIVAALGLAYLGTHSDALGDAAAEVRSTVEPDAPGTAKEAVLVTPARSIAVLPFANTSPDPDHEYFSDGISEELLNLLARIPELRVTARTSSFSFKGSSLEIPAIAKRLNVAYVLEGSVRRAGNRVRVAAQLIEARTGASVWSQGYERTLEDIFAIQDDIATDVVRQLEVTLLGDAPRTRKTDPEAHALYLQAVELRRQRRLESLEFAEELLRRVVEIDPGYAPAWNERANNFANMTGHALISTEEGFSRAHDAARRALAADPRYAPAHATLGRMAMYEGDLQEAARRLEQALALEPTSFDVLDSSARLLVALGRLDDAVRIQEHVVGLDPVNVDALVDLGLAHRWAGRLEQAMAEYRTGLRLLPERPVLHFQLAIVELLRGDAQAALAEIQRESSDLWRRIGLPMAAFAAGSSDESDAALAELVASHQRDWAYQIAYVHAFRKESDLAFDWLEKAVRYEDPGLHQIAVENLFSNVQSDSRWLPFLRRLGKAPEQLVQIEFEVTLPDD